MTWQLQKDVDWTCKWYLLVFATVDCATRSHVWQLFHDKLSLMSLLTQVCNPLLRRVLFSRNAARWVKSLLYVDPAVAVVTKPHDLVCQLIHRKLPAVRPAALFHHAFWHSTIRVEWTTSMLWWKVSLEKFHNYWNFNACKDLKAHLSLETFPYPVHRLDKVCVLAFVSSFVITTI